jgi:hypothetical protein
MRNLFFVIALFGCSSSSVSNEINEHRLRVELAVYWSTVMSDQVQRGNAVCDGQGRCEVVITWDHGVKTRHRLICDLVGCVRVFRASNW